MRLQRFSIVLLSILFCLSSVARADEGMWLVNQPPRELLQKKYSFDLSDKLLERIQKGSVRFNNGGSGSFVSPNGLVVTNHHIGADALHKLSTKDRDLLKTGFLARTQSEELPCPDLELNVLQQIVDVTPEVQSAVKPEMTPAEALAARKTVIARITKESKEKTGLRSDVVTLYHGGLYHLYRYKQYTDVRLVMAPEQGIAFFGGDTDNFEYPRFNLDVCFFRVYENGKPARTEHYFPWSKTGPADGDLVFVSGHPGTTNRLETVARLKHRRDVLLPHTLQLLRQREALLMQHSEKGPEQRRQANADLHRVANARKALTGQYQGLLTPSILATKTKIENELRKPIETDPASEKSYGSPWKTVEKLQQQLAQFERLYLFLEKGEAFDSRLFSIARHLVRLAEELPKEDGKRLAEYRSAGLDSLKLQLFSPAPIHEELERVKLSGSLSFLAENLGGEHPLVLQILAGQSPAARAEQLVGGTRIKEVAERKRLFDGGKSAVIQAKDPILVLASSIDGEARKLRARFDELDVVQQQAYAGLSRALFDKHGTSIPPDATFTLRLAFGVVKGYEVDGVKLPFTTTFGGAFLRAKEHNNREPFNLPERWLKGVAKLDPATPFNFVSTADTIGGNSGSPVLNRAGELVGINFDRNRHGLVRNFVYTEEQARHVSVHSRGVLHALETLYGAGELVRELTAGR